MTAPVRTSRSNSTLLDVVADIVVFGVQVLSLAIVASIYLVVGLYWICGAFVVAASRMARRD